MTYRCWTCGNNMESQDVVRCARQWCTAKKEQAKDAKAAQQRKWAEEDKPDHFDTWSGI